MKLPAIRAKMGTWTYYMTTLTFEQVSDFVSKVDDELHKSESLKELIQRSITANYISIRQYILNQPELFFNSLVLAVYNDYPIWQEVELKYDNSETFQVGLLNFPGKHKIFPVDGQHRVEGIKAALTQNPKLKNEKIGAIFIGHKNDENGMRKTRRLFSTLNRYAKPVTMDDIIALDEDDSVAIVTREMLENFELFSSNRVTKSKNKAIADNDKVSITSIIALYQCNRELLKIFRSRRKINAPSAERDKKSLEEYLKFRPDDQEVELFNEFCDNFWEDFTNGFKSVKKYLANKGDVPAEEFRNRKSGGNLIFRPVAILPLIQAAIEIHKRKGDPFSLIFTNLNKLDFTISKSPWRYILWSPNEKTMVMGTSGIVKLLLLYQYNVIKASELVNLKRRYADRLNIKINEALKGIKVLNNKT